MMTDILLLLCCSILTARGNSDPGPSTATSHSLIAGLMVSVMILAFAICVLFKWILTLRIKENCRIPQRRYKSRGWTVLQTKEYFTNAFQKSSEPTWTHEGSAAVSHQTQMMWENTVGPGGSLHPRPTTLVTIPWNSVGQIVKVQEFDALDF